MIKFIIDRFEEDFAVVECEDKSMKNIPRSILPQNAKEGDFIIEEDNGILNIDNEGAATKNKRISSLMNELFVD